MTHNTPRITVFLDANPLHSDQWIHPGIQSLLQSVTADPMLTVELKISEIAEKELGSWFTELTSKHIRNIDKARVSLEKLGYAKLPKVPTPADIETTFKKSLDLHGIKSIAVPYEQINLADLAQRCIDKKPPFKEKDLGFKDALIARTISEYAKKYSETDIVVITADGRFKEYLEELFGEFPERLTIHDTIGEFASTLHLRRSQLDENLQRSAMALFYSATNPKSLFTVRNIEALLKDDYGQRYPDVEAVKDRIQSLQLPRNALATLLNISDRTLTASDTLVYINAASQIGDTQFIGNDDKLLHWSTEVHMIHSYAVTTETENATVTSPSTLEHVMHYQIAWDAKLGPDGKLTIASKDVEIKSAKESRKWNLFGGLFYSQAKQMQDVIASAKNFTQPLNVIGSSIADMQLMPALNGPMQNIFTSGQTLRDYAEEILAEQDTNDIAEDASDDTDNTSD